MGYINNPPKRWTSNQIEEMAQIVHDNPILEAEDFLEGGSFRTNNPPLVMRS